jgi:hypothetical protein
MNPDHFFQIVSLGVTIIGMACAGIAAFVTMSQKNTMSAIKTDIANVRVELVTTISTVREWVNGSFMRSGEVSAKLIAVETESSANIAAMKLELEHCAKRLDSVERNCVRSPHCDVDMDYHHRPAT